MSLWASAGGVGNDVVRGRRYSCLCASSYPPLLPENASALQSPTDGCLRTEAPLFFPTVLYSLDQGFSA